MDRVYLFLACPNCGSMIWDRSGMNAGEFKCARCGMDFPCECMTAFSWEVE